jgi:hypothetical protein
MGFCGCRHTLEYIVLDYCKLLDSANMAILKKRRKIVERAMAGGV